MKMNKAFLICHEAILERVIPKVNRSFRKHLLSVLKTYLKDIYSNITMIEKARQKKNKSKKFSDGKNTQ